MVYNRQESFTGHVHRHPARIRAEHHATRDGRLVCVRMNILLDGGAYASSSTAVTANAASFACGPYAVPNALIETTSVFTNNPPCGAMRGFGAVQTCFAAEAQMDKLAQALELDPVELRLLNALDTGGTLPTGQRITGSLPVAEVIRRCAALREPDPEELPRAAIRLPGGAGNTTRGEGVKRGVGFAVGFKNLAYSEGFDDSCAARVRLFEDGSAEVHCAAAEVGQGVTNVILQVARTELGTDDVRIAPGTTAAVGSAGSASASRMTWMAAGAVRDACRAALAEREARGGEVDVERVYRHRPHGAARSRDGPGRRAARARRVRVRRDEGRRRGGRRPRPDARSSGSAPRRTSGKAINPQAVEGQIEGGTAQGLGLALMEEIQTRDGLITNASFTDYLIPTALDVPPIVSELVEHPEPDAPYGVKGVGEPPTVVSTAAVVAALRDATGRELTRVPVSARRDRGPPSERGDDLAGARLRHARARRAIHADGYVPDMVLGDRARRPARRGRARLRARRQEHVHDERRVLHRRRRAPRDADDPAAGSGARRPRGGARPDRRRRRRHGPHAPARQGVLRGQGRRGPLRRSLRKASVEVRCEYVWRRTDRWIDFPWSAQAPVGAPAVPRPDAVL